MVSFSFRSPSIFFWVRRLAWDTAGSLMPKQSPIILSFSPVNFLDRKILIFLEKVGSSENSASAASKTVERGMRWPERDSCFNQADSRPYRTGIQYREKQEGCVLGRSLSCHSSGQQSLPAAMPHLYRFEHGPFRCGHPFPWRSWWPGAGPSHLTTMPVKNE